MIGLYNSIDHVANPTWWEKAWLLLLRNILLMIAYAVPLLEKISLEYIRRWWCIINELCELRQFIKS